MKISKILNGLDFEDTQNLRKTGTITIPEDVDIIGTHAFAYLYNLNEIEIPQNIKQISTEAFLGCNNLKTIKFCNAPFLENNAFSYCNQVEKLIFSVDFTKALDYTPVLIDQYIKALKQNFPNCKVEFENSSYTLDEPENE